LNYALKSKLKDLTNLTTIVHEAAQRARSEKLVSSWLPRTEHAAAQIDGVDYASHFLRYKLVLRVQNRHFFANIEARRDLIFGNLIGLDGFNFANEVIAHENPRLIVRQHSPKVCVAVLEA